MDETLPISVIPGPVDNGTHTPELNPVLAYGDMTELEYPEYPEYALLDNVSIPNADYEYMNIELPDNLTIINSSVDYSYTDYELPELYEYGENNDDISIYDYGASDYGGGDFSFYYSGGNYWGFSGPTTARDPFGYLVLISSSREEGGSSLINDISVRYEMKCSETSEAECNMTGVSEYKKDGSIYSYFPIYCRLQTF